MFDFVSGSDMSLLFMLEDCMQTYLLDHEFRQILSTFGVSKFVMESSHGTPSDSSQLGNWNIPAHSVAAVNDTMCHHFLVKKGKASTLCDGIEAVIM